MLLQRCEDLLPEQSQCKHDLRNNRRSLRPLTCWPCYVVRRASALSRQDAYKALVKESQAQLEKLKANQQDLQDQIDSNTALLNSKLRFERDSYSAKLLDAASAFQDAINKVGVVPKQMHALLCLAGACHAKYTRLPRTNWRSSRWRHR